MTEKKYNYFMRVPNNHFGLWTIEEMRKYINKDSYRIYLRGSNPDWDKASQDGISRGHNHFRASVSLKYAKTIRIYIQAKVEKEHKFSSSYTVLNRDTVLYLRKLYRENFNYREKYEKGR